MNIRGYEVEVRRLSPNLGSGFVAFAPELIGCVADGESRTITLLNLEDAMSCWLDVARTEGRSVPPPSLADV